MSLQTLVKSQYKSTKKRYHVSYEVSIVYDGEKMIFPFNTNYSASIFSNDVLRRFTGSEEPIEVEKGRQIIKVLYKLIRILRDCEL